MISAHTPPKLYWNYFLALERDLETSARYVEFCPENLSVFSLEFAHLLFAAASEVDVVAKAICKIVADPERRENIDDYRKALEPKLPELAKTKVFVPRYGLSFPPWDNWANGRNPDWWTAYNKVKHERNTHFQQATLQNALNAMGALLIFNFHYYRLTMKPLPDDPRGVTETLNPQTILLRLPDNFYYQPVFAS